MLAAAHAAAQNVFVTTIAPSQAQVIVDGSTIRTLRVGETSPEGVRLAEIRQGAALFDIRGRPVTLGLGQSTLVRTTLQADARGHFVTQARVNGVPVSTMIDTGATHVTLNRVQAGQMGIDVRGLPRNVQGKMLDGGNETLPFVLIGMSFLQQVEMHRRGTMTTLSRPHLQ